MKNRRYTTEEREFLANFIPGHSYREIAEAFNSFTSGDPITPRKAQTYCQNNKIQTGRKGYFQKGHVPSNKGTKMKPETIEKIRRTMFHEGHRPANAVEVGSELMRADGYVWVKVSEPNTWKPKHVLRWEAEHGQVPKGSCVIFMDRDRMNFNPENLRCVTRRELMQLNRNDWISEDPEVTETRIVMADIEIRINDLSKRKNS